MTLRIHSPCTNLSTLPHCSSSSLGLAVSAILALIPPPEKTHTGGNKAIVLRRAYADLLARSALETLEDSLEKSSHDDVAKGPRSTLHSAIPRKMEPVLALELLSLYEYCQRGNIPKMRVRANQALTIAMDLSLHIENNQTGCLDVLRRCWWSTVSATFILLPFLFYYLFVMLTRAAFPCISIIYFECLCQFIANLIWTEYIY